MRHLYLVRHAKAVKDAACPDAERPLSNRGARDVPRMVAHLVRHGCRPDGVISSSATRAMATARLIAEGLGFPVSEIIPDNAIYQADAGDLLQVIHGFRPTWRCVLLVGHNPTLTDAANTLTDELVENIPTCGVMEIVFEVEWAAVAAGDGEAVYFDFPRNAD